MPQFHETRIGRKFLESDLPRAIDAMLALTEALNKNLEAKAVQPVESDLPHEDSIYDIKVTDEDRIKYLVKNKFCSQVSAKAYLSMSTEDQIELLIDKLYMSPEASHSSVHSGGFFRYLTTYLRHFKDKPDMRGVFKGKSKLVKEMAIEMGLEIVNLDKIDKPHPNVTLLLEKGICLTEEEATRVIVSGNFNKVMDKYKVMNPDEE